MFYKDVMSRAYIHTCTLTHLYASYETKEKHLSYSLRLSDENDKRLFWSYKSTNPAASYWSTSSKP